MGVRNSSHAWSHPLIHSKINSYSALTEVTFMKTRIYTHRDTSTLTVHKVEHFHLFITLRDSCSAPVANEFNSAFGLLC